MLFRSEFQDEQDHLKALKLNDIKGFKFTNEGLKIDKVEGAITILETDTFILATGQQPDLDTTFGVELFRGSHIKTGDKLQTSVQGVFAAGDAIYGTKSVVAAIASGKDAARAIDLYLGGDGDIEEVLYERAVPNPYIGKKERFASLKRVSHLLSECGACEEASRCLQCDLRLQIEPVKYWVDPHFKTVKEVSP